MSTNNLLRSLRVVLALLAVPGVAAAADPSGMWLRENSQFRIRIGPCGSALCGIIARTQTPRTDEHNPDPSLRSRSLIGVRVLFMRPDGDTSWRGEAYNPEDGHTYRGSMTLSGSRLTTRGCVLGGLICRSIGWVRAY